MHKGNQLILLMMISSIQIISASLMLNCDSKFVDFASVNSQKSCVVQNILNITAPNTKISEIHGEPTNQYLGLVIDDKKTEFLPANLGEKFTELIALKVIKGRLKEIRQTELESLPKLRYINLDDNDIEFLDDELFIHNSQLEVIWFKENKISYIGVGVFDNLKHLNKIDLTKNECASTMQMVMDRYNYTLLEIIRKNCSSGHAEVDYLFRKSKLANSENLNLIEKLEDLKLKNADNDLKVYEQQQTNGKYKQESDQKKQQMDDELQILSEMEKQLRKNVLQLQTQTDQLDMQNGNLTSTTATLSKNLTSNEAQLNNLMLNSSQTEEKLNNTSKMSSNLQQQVNESQNELSAAIEENKNLRENLESFKSDQMEDSYDDSKLWIKIILLTITVVIVLVVTTIDVLISFKN